VGSEPKADLILKNATVWTVDPSLPRAEAVAIKGTRILAVGQDAEMESLIGAGTEILDLGGRLVLPGFHDNHTHFVTWALASAGSFDLYGADTLEEVQKRVKRGDRDHPGEDWLWGMRWQPLMFDDGWPNAMDLDAAVRGRPIAILDIDGHTGWVNSKGLERLGYDASTPDPLGGTILRDASGNPTGILLENAHESIPRKEPTGYEEVKAALLGEIVKLNRLGITSLSDNFTPLEIMEQCALIAEEGALNLRINYWPLLMEEFDSALVSRKQFANNPRIQVVGLKALVDGVLSSRTAWMLEPYPDSSQEAGYPLVDMEELANLALQADKEGFQLVIHAIGDRAAREVLNVYERVARENGPRDRRHRIEHLEVIHPLDQKRMAELGVVAAMMPGHYCEPLNFQGTYKDLEVQYQGKMSVWRTFVDMGVHLSFGTDWPAMDTEQPDPLQQIFAAVARVPPQMPDAQPKNPEQALTIEQAIRSYTMECAYAEFTDDVKGSITAGKYADLCVLDRNILEIDPKEILDTKVVMTVFDGQVVFSDI